FSFLLVSVVGLWSDVFPYWVGCSASWPLLWRWLGRERLTSYEAMVARGGTTLLIGMRLVPLIPFSLFSYAAGSARVPVWRFMWTTAVGYVPLTAVFAYVGSRLEELSLGDPLLWAGVLVVIVLLLLTRRVTRSLGLGDAA
ncbi:MAG: TVP38/TMEM64 family protein, partial [Solirubrobacterales bacterium]